MTVPIRICRDCKHSGWARAWKSYVDRGIDPRHWMNPFADNAPPMRCCRPAFEAIDLVTGHGKYPTAASMREPGGACGQEGKLWEEV